MTARAVLFDLDGTLLDTLADLAHATNAVLEQAGFPTHPVDAYRRFIGEGVVVLFRRSLPVEARRDELIARCVEEFGREYGRSWNVRTRPYEGIPELLDELTVRGIALALLSNKPDAFTHRCAEEYLARWPFRAVIGNRPDLPRKPDPAGAREVARLLDLPADGFLYLGDSSIDMKTARAAGMRAIGAAWGFRTRDELWSSGAEAVIERPAALLDLL
jgi:phosphoglycolate phosphatase